MSVLAVKGLVKRFGGLTATDHLDLDVREGEIHAIIGPNGAGKTTLINQLSGEILPDEGEIVLDGVDVVQETVHRRARIGIARSYQITSVFLEFTALQNVMLAVQGATGESMSFWRPAMKDRQLTEPALQLLRQVGLGADANTRVSMLAGRNGMGRSTTIKTVMGMMAPRKGSSRLADSEIGGGAPHWVAREGLGLVPEGRRIFPNLTVRENLVATAENRRKIAEPWTLERVYGMFPRLKEREKNLGSNLSGGEQQMLAIGRALMTNPRLLILDEATEGLAPLIRGEI